MRRDLAVALAVAAVVLGPVACGGSVPDRRGVDPSPSPATDRPTTSAPALLVFSRTAGYRHASIPAGIAALRKVGAEAGLRVDATEDAAVFTAPSLSRYRAVVFLSTTGDVLDAAQQRAFEAYVRAGGGYVGVHAAADGDRSWPFYTDLVGAVFARHPDVQRATVIVEDRTHPSMEHLGPTWTRTDEWYDFLATPRGKVRVLARVDESTYRGGGMGADHPIAWCHPYAGGRSWYTALGHTDESFAEPAFRAHLLGGVRYAAGLVAADCTPR